MGAGDQARRAATNPVECLIINMKIESKVRAKFRRKMLSRLSADMTAIGGSLGVDKYMTSTDFRTEVMQSLGVGYYDPGTSLKLAFGEGGELTKTPFYVIALVLEFHNRSLSRFRKLSLAISVARFGSKYKVRGTVGWNWPLRVKYESGYSVNFPFSASDAKLFEEHLSRMESVFISTARRSLKRAA